MCARKVGAELFTYNGVDFRLIRRTWISSCACWSSEPAATEHLGSGRILSTDQRDFGAYRWKNRKPFQNLLG